METLTKPFFRWKELNERYGPKLLERILLAGWLRPASKSHRLAIYDPRDVARVDERLLSGEMPPTLSQLKRLIPMGDDVNTYASC